MAEGTAARPRSLGECATLACLWEAVSAKPGCVHRGADFDDVTFADFATSAVAVGSAVDRSLPNASVGGVALEAVSAMRNAVGTNTHLGTILLVAPLAVAARRPGSLRDNARHLVGETTVDDARLAYEAIRLAAPSGLGKVDRADVAETPDITLLEAMTLAADRDLVARQYPNGFGDVFRIAGRVSDHARAMSLHDAIVAAHVEQMARRPDSLITRKGGDTLAHDASTRAGVVLGAGPPGSEPYAAALADLDFWLRSDGHRRNPGTTADLIAAALFVLLAEERLEWPVQFYG